MSRVGQPSAFPLGLERVLWMLLVAAAILFPATAVFPQVAPDLASALHVDLDQPPSYLAGPRATGHVTNDSGYRLTNVRLRLDAFDAAGQALPPTFGWVDGDVPAHGRGWFRMAVPPNAVRLTVTVVDFTLVSIEAP